MATLPAGDGDAVWAVIMQRLSQQHIEVPATKDELRTLVDIIDGELDSAEVAVVQAIPVEHPGRQWLINNPTVGRRIMELILEKRREVL